jgi:phosphatidylserine decarboxylase
MGMFHSGGASFLLIDQQLSDQQVVFVNEQGEFYPQQPSPSGGSAGTGTGDYPTTNGA